MSDDLFNGLGIEVSLPTEDSFLKIVETLTRIGIASKKDKKLFQSCHILHKRGRYSILHFKELFILDGKIDNLTDDDIARRNLITSLLEEWGLLDINHDTSTQPIAPISQIKIIPHKEKHGWDLIQKYTIGNN